MSLQRKPVGGADRGTVMDDQHLATAKAAIATLDLSSADGRAGARTLLRQIEEQAPGSLEQTVASLQLRRLGLPTAH